MWKVLPKIDSLLRLRLHALIADFKAVFKVNHSSTHTASISRIGTKSFAFMRERPSLAEMFCMVVKQCWRVTVEPAGCCFGPNPTNKPWKSNLMGRYQNLTSAHQNEAMTIRCSHPNQSYTGNNKPLIWLITSSVSWCFLFLWTSFKWLHWWRITSFGTELSFSWTRLESITCTWFFPQFPNSVDVLVGSLGRWCTLGKMKY